MTTAADRAWIEARITKTKALIVKYEDAIDALSIGGASSYSLDTGQTRQQVTKQDISKLTDVLNSLENRVSTLEAKLGKASFHMVPAF